AADSTGVYFVGMTAQPSYNTIRKFDSAGNDLWTHQYNRFDVVLSIAPDNQGAYVLLLTGPPFTVARLDLTGAEVWTRQVINPEVASAVAPGPIVADKTGFYLAGAVNSALPGQCYAGQGDMFLARFDPFGNPIWTREFGSAGFERPAEVSIGAAGID